MKLSIVIPAFNEERTIVDVLNKIIDIQLADIEKEIIVIDDGSKDSTVQKVKGLTEKNKQITLVRHKINQGKGAAVVTGIKRSTGDLILIQDADSEYDPADIPRLLKPILDKKAQVVYGVRTSVKSPVLLGKRRTPLLLHAFGNKFLSFITSLLYGYTISDMETGYKLFNRKVIEGIRLRSRSFDLEPEITAKILKRKIRIFEIPIQTYPRSYEEGKKLYAIKDGPIALWTLIKYKFRE